MLKALCDSKAWCCRNDNWSERNIQSFQHLTSLVLQQNDQAKERNIESFWCLNCSTLYQKWWKWGETPNIFNTSLVLQQKYERRESFMMVLAYKFDIRRKKLYKKIITISLSWVSNMYWVETFYSILRYWEFYENFQNFNKMSQFYIFKKPQYFGWFWTLQIACVSLILNHGKIQLEKRPNSLPTLNINMCNCKLHNKRPLIYM